MRVCQILAAGAAALSVCLSAKAAEVLVEAESFGQKGGWVVDTQFADVMGSSYLLAHGLGVPVADAVATVALPSAGAWRLWVRTRDWTPDFAGEKPGRFQIAVNGASLSPVFGTAPAGWGWVDGGVLALERPEVEVRLRDLTGFDGRCDALCFTDDLAAPPPPDGGDALRAWRAARRGEASVPEASGDYDFVVVGGGLAGTCAAIAAAEKGLSVALIQDRQVLGGNGSSEIRVRTEGEKRHRIVSAVANDAVNMSSGSVTYDARRMSEVAKYPAISLFTGWRAYGVVTNGQRRLEAVDARQTGTGERRRFRAPLFADCTGDAWIGFWAGASYRMGREAASEFGESRAPATADAMTMGNSLMWTSRDAGAPSAFPPVPWALPVSGSRAATGGDWNWEYGMHLDTIADAEAIRDHLLRAIYGNFYNAKQNAANATRALDWVPYVAGKRESRRLLGDYLLTQADIVSGAYFEDAVGTATWHIDLHYPTAVSYLSTFTGTAVSTWYFPFRCLYSRDIPNLFMAGRNISVSHVALGSPRVMNTCGQMGVAVGYAAGLCKDYGCLPRDIYRSVAKTAELQLLIGGVWPQRVIREEDPEAVAVRVDNAQVPPSDIAGSWVASAYAAGQFEGTNYLHDGNTGKGPNKWVRFIPDLPQTAFYEVRQKWSSDGNRSTNVTVEIAHADGTNTVRVNMRANGGVWNSLGVWRFSRGRAGGARILTEGSEGGYVMADAFLFSCTNAVVVDNLEAERSGAWVSSTSMTGQFYGTNYLHSNKAASDSLWVRYRPVLPETGNYRLQAIWNGPNERATAARVEVAGADGVVTGTVDMTQNVGQWRTVGFYRFEAGSAGWARLLTAGSAGKFVIADAFRWTRTDETGLPEVDPEDWDANGLPDVWERYYFLNEGGADPDADPDGDGLCNGGECLAGTDPTDPASTFNIRELVSGGAGQPGPDALTLRWASLEGRVYDVLWAESLAGPYSALAAGLPATPPSNRFTVDTAGRAAGFFKIVVRAAE
jgi:hypothetical protein